MKLILYALMRKKYNIIKIYNRRNANSSMMATIGGGFTKSKLLAETEQRWLFICNLCC